MYNDIVLLSITIFKEDCKIMKKGSKKNNVLDCTISMRVSKEEKLMLEKLQKEKYFNISKYFRDMIREIYEKG